MVRLPLLALGALVLGGSLVPASGLAAKKPAGKKACVLKKKAKCKKAKLIKVKVGKQNLSGANLAGATIAGAKFTGTDLTGVDLTGATITNTTFTNVKVGGMVLDRARVGGVTFTRATIGGARQAARVQQCDVASDAQDPQAVVYTCTGGGVSFRDASFLGNVTIRDSTIPRSNFSNAQTFRSGASAPLGQQFGFWALSLLGTDASQSNFSGAKVLIVADKSNVSRSAFDGAKLGRWTDTNASSSSVLGASWLVYVPGPGVKVDMTGVRGLGGPTSVRVALGAGLPQAFVGPVNIREDGYWRAGILCKGLANPCANDRVAVDAPVVVSALATSPVEFTGAPAKWSCTRTPDLVTTAAYPYGATCRAPAATTDATTLTLRPYSPRTVRVVAKDGLNPSQDWALSTIRLDVVSDAGAVLDTTTCSSAATCSKVVNDGEKVSVTVADAVQQLVGWCYEGASMFTATAPPNSTYACPAEAITADRTVTVYAS